jgi:hypothetical protein
LVYFCISIWNFHDHFMANRYFCGHLLNFPRFGVLYQEKSGNPALHMYMHMYLSLSYHQCFFTTHEIPRMYIWFEPCETLICK